MLPLFLIAATVMSAEPAAEQLQLLKTFRAEFVEITPGENKFPQSYQRGEVDGAAKTRTVVFDYTFSIAKYEIPQNLYEAVMGKNPSRWKGPRNSVEMVNLAEAQAFCAKATELMREAKLIGADEVIRLPSESEWEYVARAGTDTTYSFGDNADKLGDYAWFTGNAAGNDPPVGVKEPNAWKLYDIHGYLWEWCSDDWSDDDVVPAKGAAYQATPASKNGVLRGGSWKDKAPLLTSRYRRSAPKDLRDDAVGLRCVLAKATP